MFEGIASKTMDQPQQESEDLGLPLQFVLTDDGDRRLAMVTGAVGGGLLLVLVLVGVVAGADAPTWLFVALGLVAAVLLVVMFVNIRVWLGWGNPQLFLPSSADLRLGDYVVARFRRTARRGAGTGGLEVSAWLEAIEIVGVGEAAATEQVSRTDGEVKLVSLVHRSVEADLVLDIPLGATPSFLIEGFEMRWQLVVRIEAPSAPDDDSTFPVVVAPAVAERVQSGGRGR